MEGFAAQFEQAVVSTGSDYVNARQAILGRGAVVLPSLEAKRADSDWKVRLTAEILIGWLRQKSLFEKTTADVQARWVETSPVKPITGQMSATKRAYAVAARGQDVTPRLLEMLTKTIELDKAVERDTVLVALSYLADKRATLPLLYVLNRTTDLSERSRIAGVLGALKDPRAVEPLLGLAGDPAQAVDLRRSALIALAAVGDSRAREPLQNVLRDERQAPALRQGAAYALGVLGDPAASDSLAAVLDVTEDENLIRLAVEALGKIGDAKTLPTVRRVEQRHPSGLIYRAAARARAAITARVQRQQRPIGTP